MLAKSLDGLGRFLLFVMALLMMQGAAHASRIETINGIQVETVLPNGQNGVPYSKQIEPASTTPPTSDGPYTFELIGGALPVGLTLSPSGLITGTSCEHTNGAHKFEIRITAAGGAVADFADAYYFEMNMTGSGPGTGVCALNLGDLPTTGQQGTPYSGTIAATGGSGLGYTFVLTSGTVPAGLSLGSSGTLSGTPTAAGTYTFTVTGTDSVGNTGVRTYTVTINAPPVVVSPPELGPATNGTAFTGQVTATGGTGTGYTFAITAGALPDGLTMATTGAITGTPTAAGTFTFTVTATDSGGNTGLRTYTMTVDPGAVLTLSPPALPNGLEDTPYSQAVTASGGTGTGYVFTLTGGSLPTGLTLASSGAITGTPTVPGSSTFTVTATDSAGNTGTRTYTIEVQALGSIVISPSTLPGGTRAEAYSQTLTATGGTGTGYVFTQPSGTLPPGLALSSAGEISGTPTTLGTFTFTVQVVDSANNTASQTYAVVIAGHTLTLSPTTLPDGVNGTPYPAQTITTTGGLDPYTYAVTAGGLPAGLTLSSGGVISGTPTSAGTYTFTVTSTDVDGDTGTQAYTVTIAPGAVLTVLPTQLPAADYHTPYSAQVFAQGGTGTGYVFTIVSGSLPAGLQMNSAGLITGSADAIGDFPFTVRATDSAGNTGTRAYDLHVHPGNVLTINPATLAGPNQGTPYSQTVVATGGVAPYTYSVVSGALPTGLTLDPATGLISGTPSASGTFNVTIGAVDSLGNYGNRVYTISVAARLDPSKDPEVAGLIDAHFNAAGRFAEGQLNNLMRHMEGLHGGFDCGIANGLTLGTTGDGRLPGQHADADRPASSARGAATAHEPRQQCTRGVRLWTAGSADIDKDQGYSFNAQALTLGIDAKLGERLIVGAAAGYGFGDDSIGYNGTHTGTRATSVMGYASYNPLGAIYLDGSVGRTWVRFDNRRFVTARQAIDFSERKGHVTFASLALTGEKQIDEFTIAGFARFDYFAIRLDGFAERSLDPFALTFGEARQDREVAVAGLRAERAFAQDWGILKPRARVEYRHRFNGAYTQGIVYSDTPLTTYTLARGAQEHDVISVSAGLEAVTEQVAVSVEYGTSAMSLDSFGGHNIRVMMRTQF